MYVSQGGTGEAQYQPKMCGNHETNPGDPIGGSWDQIWSSGALRGPPRSPKGAPVGPGMARYQAKVCGNHVSNLGGHIGGSRDQIWPPGPTSRAPKRAFCLFLNIFSSWVVPYGLDEQGVPLQCSGHLTRLYFEQKISPKNGAMEI